MDLSICIVSYNCRELLRRCLRSIGEHRGSLDLEVIVVDNASSDGTVAMVAAEFPQVDVMASERNLGFAGGTNLGMAVARGEVLMMLNPDTEVTPGALGHLVRFLHGRRDAGAVGPRLEGPDGRLQHTCHPFPSLWLTLVAQLGLHRLLPGTHAFGAYDMTWWAHDEPRRVGWLSGACIALRREVWERLGGLDEGYFMYSEDVDWCYRLSRAGYERWYLPQARVIHHEAASWASAPRERILTSHRANFRFFGKNYGHMSELCVRCLVAAGALLRGTFWTIAGPVLGHRPGIITDAQTHFRVAELAMDLSGTYRWRRRTGRE